MKKSQKRVNIGEGFLIYLFFSIFFIFFRNMSKMLNDLILRFTVELK